MNRKGFIMYCPKDKTELKQITKEGVVIDFCPACRGVWLDRGELDKIIERSVAEWNERDEKIIEEETEKPEYPNIERDDHIKRKPAYRGVGSNFLGALFDLDDPGAAESRTFFGRK